MVAIRSTKYTLFAKYWQLHPHRSVAVVHLSASFNINRLREENSRYG